MELVRHLEQAQSIQVGRNKLAQFRQTHLSRVMPDLHTFFGPYI